MGRKGNEESLSQRKAVKRETDAKKEGKRLECVQIINGPICCDTEWY